MKILIVEDEFDKREKIKTHIHQILGEMAVIVECESLRSGLSKIVVEGGFDLILLDMSMPNFDISDDATDGGKPESFAGREIMAQMKLRGICTPVIVITQYRSFEKGTVTLDGLLEQFKEKYSDFFMGAIYYNSAIEGWKKELTYYIDRFR